MKDVALVIRAHTEGRASMLSIHVVLVLLADDLISIPGQRSSTAAPKASAPRLRCKATCGQVSK